MRSLKLCFAALRISRSIVGYIKSRGQMKRICRYRPISLESREPLHATIYDNRRSLPLTCLTRKRIVRFLPTSKDPPLGCGLLSHSDRKRCWIYISRHMRTTMHVKVHVNHSQQYFAKDRETREKGRRKESSLYAESSTDSQQAHRLSCKMC